MCSLERYLLLVCNMAENPFEMKFFFFLFEFEEILCYHLCELGHLYIPNLASCGHLELARFSNLPCFTP